MIELQKNFYLGSGVGNSSYKLVSFDNALLYAGISNYNLLKVSSILPAACERKDAVSLKQGSPLLTAYASITSDVEGELLASAVGVGIPKDMSQVGIIMEYSANGISEEEARNVVSEMVKESMKNHRIDLKTILITSASTIVSKGYSSLVSAIAMW